MTPSRYASPEAFKQALEERIRQSCRDTRTDIARFRQLLVFDRSSPASRWRSAIA